jgi:hypothetical protein
VRRVFMNIPRLLILLALILACVAPAGAQSPEKNAAPPDGLNLQHTTPGTADDSFTLRTAPRLLQQARTLQQLALNQNDATCYSIRVYRVKRDDQESDSTKPAGYSICQPSARFQVKTAVETIEIAPR